MQNLDRLACLTGSLAKYVMYSQRKCCKCLELDPNPNPDARRFADH